MFWIAGCSKRKVPPRALGWLRQSCGLVGMTEVEDDGSGELELSKTRKSREGEPVGVYWGLASMCAGEPALGLRGALIVWCGLGKFVSGMQIDAEFICSHSGTAGFNGPAKFFQTKILPVTDCVP